MLFRSGDDVDVEGHLHIALAAQEASDRAVRVVEASSPEELPRIGRERTDFRCKFCSFKSKCWGDVPAAPAPSRVSYGIAQAMPTRAYFVAEHVKAADGTGQWMKYQGVFQSPAACWEGLGKYVKSQEKFVYGQYQAMGDSAQSRQWYWDRVAELNARKAKITCVTE